jgi:hypothetical protein
VVNSPPELANGIRSDGAIGQVTTARRGRYCRTALNVMFVGGSLVQLPPTPGLVHVSVFAPAGPETDSVPLHAVPVLGLLMLIVHVPENDVAVVVPPTLPLFGTVPPVVCHVPLTAAPVCVSVMASP